MKQPNLWAISWVFVVGAAWACTETGPADTSHSNAGSGNINPFGGANNQGGTDNGGTDNGGNSGTGGTPSNSDAAIPDAAPPQSDAQAIPDAAPANHDATAPVVDSGCIADSGCDGG